MKLTKETLGEALDRSYASDSGINCSDLNHADLILEAAQRLYDKWDEREWQPIETLNKKKNAYLWLWVEYKDKSGSGYHEKGFIWEGDGKIEVNGFQNWDYEHKEITHWMPYIKPKPPQSAT